MAKLDDATKLLAIGLLNYADDEGYFFADWNLIRSALRPFDDSSTIIRRCLDHLSKTGYIELREGSSHGHLGKIISFLEHQRIDRPKASTIKTLYDSTNDRRSIDDQSSLEGKGKERKNTNSKAVPENELSVIEFCKELGLPESDGVATWNKWLANGSTNNGKPIKDWQATIRSWKAGGYMPSQKNQPPQSGQRPKYSATSKETHDKGFWGDGITNSIEEERKIKNEAPTPQGT